MNCFRLSRGPWSRLRRAGDGDQVLGRAGDGDRVLGYAGDGDQVLGCAAQWIMETTLTEDNGIDQAKKHWK
jgi:hypothetical protein